MIMRCMFCQSYEVNYDVKYFDNGVLVDITFPNLDVYGLAIIELE